MLGVGMHAVMAHGRLVQEVGVHAIMAPGRLVQEVYYSFFDLKTLTSADPLRQLAARIGHFFLS